MNTYLLQTHAYTIVASHMHSDYSLRMKKNLLTTTLFALALTAGAQSATDNPVLMTINGKPITRGEFEYSFHKNGNIEGAVEKKTVQEYVPMFVNYKLKVAAAEAAHLDTLSSFKKEFLTYRDMQLTPFMTDSTFTDSIAHMVYDNTVKQLGGKDLIQTAHILIRLGQKATEAEKKEAKAKADSLYNAIKNGADFAELAKKYSGDPGSAAKGGQLPLVGPGQFVKEYEDAAYALKKGEMCPPVLSPFGYHIIKMTDRHPLDSYEKLKSDIYSMLKRQNIDEASAEYRIKKIVDASNGRLNREAVLDSVMNANITHNDGLRYLIQEYHDGLLLYEVSKRQVWDVAAADTKGLEQWYKAHKADYAWKEPRFKGFVFHCKNAKDAKAVKKMLKKYGDGDWRKELKQQFNKDSVTVSVSGPYLCSKGENATIDVYAFKTDAKAKTPKGYVMSGVCGKVMKQPKSYLDAKAQVTSDYQQECEKKWVEQLRKQFTFSVNEDVLKTVK